MIDKMINSMNTEELDILADAISDVGCWSWWATDLPNRVQLEFADTQLVVPSDNSQPISAKIAIQFINPKSIAFLTNNQTENTKNTWYDDLHNDKIEPFSCSYENFTFSDKVMMKNIINNTNDIQLIHGYSPLDDRFYKENYQLVFLIGGGDYGFAVSAEDIKFFTKDYRFDFADIPQLQSAWWEYWKKYWQVRETEFALPKDYACEITIPCN